MIGRIVRTSLFMHLFKESVSEYQAVRSYIRYTMQTVDSNWPYIRDQVASVWPGMDLGEIDGHAYSCYMVAVFFLTTNGLENCCEADRAARLKHLTLDELSGRGQDQGILDAMEEYQSVWDAAINADPVENPMDHVAGLLIGQWSSLGDVDASKPGTHVILVVEACLMIPSGWWKDLKTKFRLVS